MANVRQCLNCLYFLETGRKSNPPQIIGICRESPPLAFIDPKTKHPTVAKFPIVLSDTWCGAWRNKESQ